MVVVIVVALPGSSRLCHTLWPQTPTAVGETGGVAGLKSPCPNQRARQADCPHPEGICQSSCDPSVPKAEKKDKKKEADRKY